MRFVTVGGTKKREALTSYLASHVDRARLLSLEMVTRRQDAVVLDPETDLIDPDSVVIVDANVVSSDFRPLLSVLVIDSPPDELDSSVRTAGSSAEFVLVETGPAFEGMSEIGLESQIKSETGARKVLIYDDPEGRERAFQKILDVVGSRLGGVNMGEDIPEKVIEAVKREQEEGKITCARAQALAGELEVPIPLVGRALDMLEIKITQCQLGCF